MFYFAKIAKSAILSSLPLRSGYNSDKWHFNAWFGCHDVRGNPSAHVSCAAVNHAGIFARECAPAMQPYAAVGVGDNLTACQTAICS